MPTVLRSERSARPSAGAACSRKRSRRASASSASGISLKKRASSPTTRPSASRGTARQARSAGGRPRTNGSSEAELGARRGRAAGGRARGRGRNPSRGERSAAGTSRVRRRTLRCTGRAGGPCPAPRAASRRRRPSRRSTGRPSPRSGRGSRRGRARRGPRSRPRRRRPFRPELVLRILRVGPPRSPRRSASGLFGGSVRSSRPPPPGPRGSRTPNRAWSSGGACAPGARHGGAWSVRLPSAASVSARTRAPSPELSRNPTAERSTSRLTRPSSRSRVTVFLKVVSGSPMTRSPTTVSIVMSPSSLLFEFHGTGRIMSKTGRSARGRGRLRDRFSP